MIPGDPAVWLPWSLGATMAAAGILYAIAAVALGIPNGEIAAPLVVVGIFVVAAFGSATSVRPVRER